MAIDYNAEAIEIAELLRREGLAELAQQVEDAVRGGSTGTEIVMGVRHFLRQVPRDQVAKKTREKVIKLIGHLDYLMG